MSRSKEVEPAPFAEWLLAQAGGKSHAELSQGLYDLVQRVKDTGKAGTLVYAVKVGLMKGDTETLVIGDEIKLKLPEHDRKSSIFFTDRDGNLSQNNPSQMSIEDLREVPPNVDPTTGEIKEIQ